MDRIWQEMVQAARTYRKYTTNASIKGMVKALRDMGVPVLDAEGEKLWKESCV